MQQHVCMYVCEFSTYFADGLETRLYMLFVCAAALAGPGKIPTSAQKELRLIQSKSDIENPRIVVEAVPLICRMFYDASSYSDANTTTVIDRQTPI